MGLKSQLKDKIAASQSIIIFTISVITLIVLAVSITIFIRTKLEIRDKETRISQDIAEDGLKMGLEKITENPLWKDGFNHLPLNGGYFSVTVERVTATDSIFRVLSVGQINDTKANRSCTYQIITDSNGLCQPKLLGMGFN